MEDEFRWKEEEGEEEKERYERGIEKRRLDREGSRIGPTLGKRRRRRDDGNESNEQANRLRSGHEVS